MSHEPCTLFWPRSGFTPAPGLPILPVDHRQVRHRHHSGGALAVLGDPQAVIDRGGAAGGDTAAPPPGQVGRVHAGHRFAVASGELRGSAMKRAQCSNAVPLAPVAHIIGRSTRPFRHHHMRHRVDQRHVGAGQQRQVVLVGLDMRGLHQVDPARDRPRSAWRSFAQPASSCARRRQGGRPSGWRRSPGSRRCPRRRRNPAYRRTCRASSSARSPSASGTPARRYRRCCCRTRRAPASAPDRCPRWCSATM